MRECLEVRSSIAGVLIIGLVLLIMLLIFGISCQAYAPTPASEPTPTAPPGTVQGPTPAVAELEIAGFAFVPATITVPVGTTATWSNNDAVTHTVSSRDKVFGSGNLSGGATFSYTFNQPGTFAYYCKIHPYMTGTVIVE